MKKFAWLRGLALCGILFLGAGVRAEAKEEAVIQDKVYLDEVDVSGMTKEEAEAALRDYAAALGQKTLTLQAAEHEVPVKLEDLGLQCANPRVVDEALSIGRSGDIIKRFKEKKELESSGKTLELTWTVDKSKVSQVIEERCVKFDVEAVDAGLSRSNGSFTVTPGSTGVKLNVEGSKTAVLDFMEQGWNKEDGVVELPAQIEEPKGTEEEMRKVKDVLGTFSTSLDASNANRVQNVTNGARLLNGTVLYPGEVLSVRDMTSPYTTENGYEAAGTYVNGRVVDGVGGGVCQVSTTLYNAVLRAELEVVERAPHSMTVTYVDPSADAAIAGTYKDFKFQNSTNAPIYIEAGVSNKQVTFTLYGEESRPAGRKVDFTSMTLSTQETGLQIIADGGQGIGYYLVDGGHRGVVAELYKHVYENGVEVSRERVNKSTYSMSPRLIVVGVAGDPGLSAELQAAIATQDEATVQAVMASCLARMPAQ